MAIQPKVIRVNTYEEFQLALTQYLSQGFAIADQTSTSRTLVKGKGQKKFNVLLAFILLLLGGIPLIVYIIYFLATSSTGSNQVIMLQVVGEGNATPPGMASPTSRETVQRQLSPDGQYWWDGHTWLPVSEG